MNDKVKSAVRYEHCIFPWVSPTVIDLNLELGQHEVIDQL